jgi:hypothetical protein
MAAPKQPFNATLVQAGDGRQDAMENFSEVRWLESEVAAIRSPVREASS